MQSIAQSTNWIFNSQLFSSDRQRLRFIRRFQATSFLFLLLQKSWKSNQYLLKPARFEKMHLPESLKAGLRAFTTLRYSAAPKEVQVALILLLNASEFCLSFLLRFFSDSIFAELFHFCSNDGGKAVPLLIVKIYTFSTAICW